MLHFLGRSYVYLTMLSVISQNVFWHILGHKKADVVSYCSMSNPQNSEGKMSRHTHAALGLPLPSTFLQFTISIFQHEQTKISQFSETKRSTIYWPSLTRGNTWCHLTLTPDLDEIFRVSNAPDWTKCLLPGRSHAKLRLFHWEQSRPRFKIIFPGFLQVIKIFG